MFCPSAPSKCWSKSEEATLARYLSFAVLGSTGNKCGFINLRRYCSKRSFMMFSSKTNIRVLILTEFTLVDVLGVSLPGKHG